MSIKKQHFTAILFLFSIIPILIYFSVHFPRAKVLQKDALFYCLSADARCLDSLKKHHNRISELGLIGYEVSDQGEISNRYPSEIVEFAKSNGIRVIPLIHNPDFDQSIFHRLLTNLEARKRLVLQLVDMAKNYGYAGWQFDFENIRIEDRDLLTAFYQEAADVLRPAGLSLSIAVVPRIADDEGPSLYSKWIYENWSGAYDYAKLAAIGDFVSVMTYDQHTRRTAPGPIAGWGWVRQVLSFLKNSGVDMNKVSLGIPAYSHHWYSTFSETRLGHMEGKQISYRDAVKLTELNNGQKTWSADDRVSFWIWKNRDINEYLYIEDYESFGERLPFVEEFDLRGISVFQLGWEDPRIWEYLAIKR